MSVPFTPEEDDRLKELYHEGANQTEIGTELSRSRESIRDRGKYLGLDWGLRQRFSAEVLAGAPLQPITLNIPARTTEPLITQPAFVDLVYGDTHFPFHDPAAVEVIYRVLELIRVDRVYHLGDIIDNWQISSFIPPDEKVLSKEQLDFSAQFQMAATHLGQVASLTPYADGERYLLEGNHEERWSRMLRKAQTDYKWRHVLGLPQVQEAMRLPSLIGAPSAGFEYYNYRENEVMMSKHLLVTHGDRTTIWAARQILQRYGKSTIFGHTHRVQNFVKRDLKATEGAWNIGCLCDLNPHYGDSTAVDWAQGFALVLYDDHPSRSDHFIVIQLRIHWGNCVTPWGTIKV